MREMGRRSEPADHPFRAMPPDEGASGYAPAPIITAASPWARPTILIERTGQQDIVTAACPVARDLGLHSSTYGERAKSLARRGNTQELASELFAMQRSNLDATEAAVAPVLPEAVKLLRKARAVHVAGFRASHPVAFALFYGYRLFRNSVSLVDGLGVGLELQLRAIERQDAVVVTSFAPYSREALAVAQHAHAAGASLVALTDSSAAPIALRADVVLQYAVASPSFFPSVAAGVALTEALLEQLVAEGGSSLLRHLEHLVVVVHVQHVGADDGVGVGGLDLGFQLGQPVLPARGVTYREVPREYGARKGYRYTMVNDFGTIVNPLLVEGQLHGGVMQGIGQALMEMTLYDAEGQLVTGSFMDYAMPRAEDAPPYVFESRAVPARTNVLGAKGCGEAGCAGSLPSVMNAVVDALSMRGVTHMDMPATPLKVWTALHGQASAG